MILWLLLCLALTGAPKADAQETRVLELPAVTLVGADTLFLHAPVPQTAGPLSQFELAPLRRAVPETTAPSLPGEPGLEAVLLRLTTGRGAAVDGGGAGSSPFINPLTGTAAASPQLQGPSASFPSVDAGGGWRFLAYYLPGQLVRSVVGRVRRVGAWDTAAELDLGLADGWVTFSPEVPTYLLGRVDADRQGTQGPVAAADRRDPSLRLRFAGTAGAFLPRESPLRYTLGVTEDMVLRAGGFSLVHGTDAAGLSAAGDRVGLLGQRLVMEVIHGGLLVHAGAAAYLRGTLEPAGGGSAGGDGSALARLAVGYRSPFGALTVAAGGAAAYNPGALDFYPEGAFLYAPSDRLRLQLGAAAFLVGTSNPGALTWADPLLRPLAAAGGGALAPLIPMGALSDDRISELTQADVLGTQAVEIAISSSALRPQSGFAVRSRVEVAAADRLRGQLAVELLRGSVYSGWGGSLSYGALTQLAGLAELSAWLVRAGRDGAGLEIAFRGFAALSLPPAAAFLEALYGERLEAEARAAFPNLPLRLIMGVMWGEIPAGMPAAAMVSPWESFSGLAASLSAEYRIGRGHGIRVGGDVRLHENEAAPEVRFVVGYRYSGS